MASITKIELAKRLRLQPGDLVLRELAAKLLDRSQKSMANKATRDALPGFYNLAGKGVRGGDIYYRLDWLKAYVAWKSRPLKERNMTEARTALEAEIEFGAQDLPGPAERSIPLAAHNMSGLSHAERLLLEEMLAKMPVKNFEVGDEIVLMSDGGLDLESPDAAPILAEMRKILLGGGGKE